MSELQHKQVGLAGLYDDAGALVRAAQEVRRAGYTRWDCHTPYPVHGLDIAMGIPASPVGGIGLLAGFAGLGAAIGLTGWLSAWHYPIHIGGKALFSWQAFVPIYFELFVLFAGLAVMGSVFALGRLGRWHSPLHDSGIMPEITCDRFAIVLEASDPNYSEDAARALLAQTGCRDIRLLIEYEEEDDAFL